MKPLHELYYNDKFWVPKSAYLKLQRELEIMDQNFIALKRELAGYAMGADIEAAEHNRLRTAMNKIIKLAKKSL